MFGSVIVVLIRSRRARLFDCRTTFVGGNVRNNFSRYSTRNARKTVLDSLRRTVATTRIHNSAVSWPSSDKSLTYCAYIRRVIFTLRVDPILGRFTAER